MKRCLFMCTLVNQAKVRRDVLPNWGCGVRAREGSQICVSHDFMRAGSPVFPIFKRI